MQNNQEPLVDKLVAILELQIKTFESLKELELMDMASLQMSEEYKQEIETLNIYLMKINRIINSIDCYPQDLEYDAQYILYNIHNYLEKVPEIDEYELSSCLSQIISQKIKELVSKQKFIDDEDEDYEAEMLVMTDENYGETDIHLSIINQIEILRIKKIEEFISQEKDQKKKETLVQYKYRLIRSNKSIADQLIQASMNTEYLLEVPDDIEALKNSVHEQNYKNQKELMIIDYIKDSLECFELSDDVKDKNNINEIISKDIDFAFVEFLLNQISTDYLKSFLIEIQNDENVDNANIVSLLTQNTLNQRDDYIKPSSELLENKECVAIKEETLNKFISLIKLSELIIEKHQELCDLEKQNQKETEEYNKILNTLKTYLEFEKEALQDLEMTDDEAKELDELLENNSSLILKNKKHEKLVQKRLENMIPDLANKFVVSGQSHNVLSVIHQTYHLTILKQFQEIIDKEMHPQLKNKLIEEKYKVCAAHQCISDDMASVSFNPDKATILDDQTITELLNVSELEYACDKDEELYVIANHIMHEMLNTKHKTESYIYYQTLCLEEILNSISLENIIALEEQYNAQLNTIKPNKENPEKRLRLKPLFQKIKPQYLKN